MIHRFKIINVVLDINDFSLKHEWKAFEIDFVKSEMAHLSISNLNSEINYGREFDLFQNNEAESIIIRVNSDIAIVNKKWENMKIFPLDCVNNEYLLIHQLFYAYIVQRHMIQLHSSLIATTDNRGLMFLGPSGIGKTTQAELWHKYREALIINGDIVFVQETENAFLGWGTPWHGSSPYCENTNVPVEALIVLKQAPENSIRELTGFEKVSEVSNSVFYPRWLENGMELCLETLDHLLSKLPVYELRCRPDEDAVRLTEETILFKN